MSFVAFDFETANNRRDSACSLGLVRMDESGKPLSSWYSLICPKEPYFSPFCTAVHHLDSRDILKSPTFEELWPEIRDFISTDPLVAHNATFDKGVLYSTANSYGITLPQYHIIDTLPLSRRLLRDLPNHKLGTLVNYFEFEYDAHNALSDALACGIVYTKLIQMESFF